jgi:hypothetical protein
MTGWNMHPHRNLRGETNHSGQHQTNGEEQTYVLEIAQRPKWAVQSA